jgi:hypothetical protein
MLEEFENTKGVIRICISKKDRQQNGEKKRYTRTNNDLQNTTHKTKDRVRLEYSYFGCAQECFSMTWTSHHSNNY